MLQIRDGRLLYNLKSKILELDNLQINII